MRTEQIFRLFLTLVIGLSSLGSLSGPAVAAFPPEEGTTSQYVVARIYYGDRNQLDLLASQLDVWEVDHGEGYLVAMLSAAQVDQLSLAGYRLEVDQAKTELIHQPLVPLLGQGTDSIPGFPCYRTLDETYTDMAALETAMPNLVDLRDIGDSWDKLTPDGPEGFDILMLRLTNENRSEKYGRFFLMAEVHAREYVTSETVLRMAEHLLANYGIDPDITWMLDYFEIYILPMSNPDGRIFAEDGEWWRKNTDDDDKDPSCVYPTYGVDLNRNNDFHWGGAETYECAETYQGPEPNSEPETQYIQAQALALFPDQRGEDDKDIAPADTTGLFISIHSYSNLVLWPWGWTDIDAPNHVQLQTLGRKMAYFNGYAPSQAYELYKTTGTNDDWAYGTLGIAAYTFELGDIFFQDCESFESTIYLDNLEALLNGFKAARRPYQNPAGPESLYVTLPTEIIYPGTDVLLTARANDTRYNNENGAEPTQIISQARYSIDNPSWVEGSLTYPMSASDGSFDSNIENIQATLDTSSLANGRHIVFVESLDADGYWGYTSAAFLNILDPATAPHITGYVTDAASGEPIEASITAGNFQTTSDPDTGFYDLVVYSGTYTITASAAYYVSISAANIQVEDGQTVQQDFALTAMCDIFFDDVEVGNLGWTAQSPWAITDEASFSPSHSWTDSPATLYANNKNISLTSPTFNLQDWDEIGLLFRHTYDIQSLYDWGIVEYSTDDGVTWQEAARFNGIQEEWSQVSLNLPDLPGAASANIRFRLYTNNLIYRDGWHIDDIQLMGTGPGCSAQPPTAEFTSSSPVAFGTPVEFTNQTSGTPPLTYAWDFGDGTGSSTAEHPTYLYAEPGTYTVTLTATNELGSDEVFHAVVVEPPACVPITEVSGKAIKLPIHPGEPVEFGFILLPEEFTSPYTYTVDFGDGGGDTDTGSANPLEFSHAYESVGVYDFSISIQNCDFSEPVTSGYTLEVTNFETHLPLVSKGQPALSETMYDNSSDLEEQSSSTFLLPVTFILGAIFGLPVIKKIR